MDNQGTHQKALRINLDPTTYGTFAEIGAGQEVARWFFRVGGAAGTVAKTMSAYDMVVSDSIYGKADRYVSRDRLSRMLDHEYSLMVQRLDATRGASTRFFVFADTVAARSFKGTGESHGWLGVRFQSRPRSEPSEILVHVRMLDRDNVSQQEALGVLGVNLIHAALYQWDDPDSILGSLLHNLSRDRVEVDMVKLDGPIFAGGDNRIVSLQLVEQGLADSAMFTATGEVVQASEVLYKKSIIVQRGSFRPVTHVNMDMLQRAREQFSGKKSEPGNAPMVLMEMTLNKLSDGERIDYRDFLERVDILGALGNTVLISNYVEFHRLAAYLFRYTRDPIGVALGVPTLLQVFNETYYRDLDGGILESFGRLFKNDLRLYVYPWRNNNTGEIVTAHTLQVEPHLRHLYRHLLENGFIQDLRGCNPDYLTIMARDVLAKIRHGDDSWETSVPAIVADMIKSRGLFRVQPALVTS
jgi:hypothetical protein